MGFRISECCDTDGIPMYFISAFTKEISIPILVELGTAGGASTKIAAKHFQNVVTIELNEDRPQYDVELKNVKWLTGNTIDVLPNLMNELINHKVENKIEDFRYALFFIDSHFDGDKPKDSPYKDCYLLEELDIISWYSQDSIVIIDDARLFMGNPPQPNDALEWPSMQEIFRKIEEKFPFFYCTLIDDYFVAIPDRLKWILDKYWMSTYDTRYPNDKERIRNATKLAYHSFLKYIQ